MGNSNATYRLACRLLLLKDFNYNNLLEAYNLVSQDCKASTCTELWKISSAQATSSNVYVGY